jgi:hypothetical protein
LYGDHRDRGSDILHGHPGPLRGEPALWWCVHDVCGLRAGLLVRREHVRMMGDLKESREIQTLNFYVERLAKGLRSVMDNLGVPSAGYPANVAHAYHEAEAALKQADQPRHVSVDGS